MAIPSPPSPDQDFPALPREVTVFLVQFSAALNKTRAYPGGHPALAGAMDVLVSRLGLLLENRGEFSLGITSNRLMADAGASSASHKILADLAEKLHRHQLAAITFRQGIQSGELDDLLRLLADESWRQGQPLGMMADEWVEERWEHLILEPLPLESLTLGEDVRRAADRKADDLWRGLTLAALGAKAGGAGGAGIEGDATTPEALAEAIRNRSDDAEFAKTIVDWIRRADQAAADSGPDSRVGRSMEGLLAALGPEALARIMTRGTDPRQRKALALSASRSLPVGAVLELLKAAEDPGHGLSHSMLRILRKLAKHADRFDAPVLPGADAALRDSVRQILGEWSEVEDTEASYRRLLDLLSKPASAGSTEARLERGPQESARLIYLGVEIGVTTPSITRAIEDFILRAGAEELLDLYAQTRDGGPAGEALHDRLADPKFFVELVLDEEVEELSLDTLVDGLGAEAMEGLLDALEKSESASRRRWLLGRLETLRRVDLPANLVDRLVDKPWFVQRNLLTLLRAVGPPKGFSVVEYTRPNIDHRVRKEAFLLLIDTPDGRAEGLTWAAADADDGIARLALSEALTDCPSELSDALPSLLRSRYRDPEIRALAIRLLGARPTSTARDWLLSQVLTRGWFGRRWLTRKSPESLACLAVLAKHWSDHEEFAVVHRLARRSRDPEVRAAVSP